MRKVDSALLTDLLEGAKEQKVPVLEVCSAPSATPVEKVGIVSAGQGWNKGHNVPEGIYLVKLVGVKCHSPNAYKMQLEVLADGLSGESYPEVRVISGFCRRAEQDCSDLSICFGSGKVHKRAAGYVGDYGIINLTHSGWVKMLPRSIFLNILPPF